MIADGVVEELEDDEDERTARWVEGTFRSFGAWHNVREDNVSARGRYAVEVGRVVLPVQLLRQATTCPMHNRCMILACPPLVLDFFPAHLQYVSARLRGTHSSQSHQRQSAG